MRGNAYLFTGEAVHARGIRMLSPHWSRRVLAGGHNVPEMDVRRRYLRSLQNLSAAGIADRVPLFDNSDDLGYQPAGLLGRGLHQWFRPLPVWAAELEKVFS